MNAPEKLPIPDIQSLPDHRHLAIDQVGIKSIRYPVQIASRGGAAQATIATFDMLVDLGADAKGTHMSRFVELLEANREPISLAGLSALTERMAQRLGARAGAIKMRFPYFINKSAPISGVQSLMDYEVTFSDQLDEFGAHKTTLEVQVPVTSLCPCSKEISAYGAHNQRSHVTVQARLNTRAPISIEELIELIERQASCELYGLLKRPDEKFVTERAYDNPKFVEDMVRDVAGLLDADERIGAYAVESENFESIHNHSAYARIVRDKTGPLLTC